jgi:predicted site-specific integrase-resolvase
VTEPRRTPFEAEIARVLGLREIPPTLKVHQVARVLNLDIQTAYRAIEEGYIPAVRVAVSSLRVPTHKLVELMDGQQPQVEMRLTESTADVDLERMKAAIREMKPPAEAAT